MISSFSGRQRRANLSFDEGKICTVNPAVGVDVFAEVRGVGVLSPIFLSLADISRVNHSVAANLAQQQGPSLRWRWAKRRPGHHGRPSP
jgi:hypothetical protein